MRSENFLPSNVKYLKDNWEIGFNIMHFKMKII